MDRKAVSVAPDGRSRRLGDEVGAVLCWAWAWAWVWACLPFQGLLGPSRTLIGRSEELPAHLSQQLRWVRPRVQDDVGAELAF